MKKMVRVISIMIINSLLAGNPVFACERQSEKTLLSAPVQISRKQFLKSYNWFYLKNAGKTLLENQKTRIRIQTHKAKIDFKRKWMLSTEALKEYRQGIIDWFIVAATIVLIPIAGAYIDNLQPGGNEFISRFVFLYNSYTELEINWLIKSAIFLSAVTIYVFGSLCLLEKSVIWLFKGSVGSVKLGRALLIKSKIKSKAEENGYIISSKDIPDYQVKQVRRLEKEKRDFSVSMYKDLVIIVPIFKNEFFDSRALLLQAI